MDEKSNKHAAAEHAIASWESEGGAKRSPAPENPLVGTEQQVAWAGKIRERVNADFDRVAAALKAAAGQQSGQDLADNMAVIAIVEDIRQQIMSNISARYFLHRWQETNNGVQRMIAADPRFIAIRKKRNRRRFLEKRRNEKSAVKAAASPL